jgi:hypothetical protein
VVKFKQIGNFHHELNFDSVHAPLVPIPYSLAVSERRRMLPRTARNLVRLPRCWQQQRNPGHPQFAIDIPVTPARRPALQRRDMTQRRSYTGTPPVTEATGGAAECFLFFSLGCNWCVAREVYPFHHYASKVRRVVVCTKLWRRCVLERKLHHALDRLALRAFAGQESRG